MIGIANNAGQMFPHFGGIAYSCTVNESNRNKIKSEIYDSNNERTRKLKLLKNKVAQLLRQRALETLACRQQALYVWPSNSFCKAMCNGALPSPSVCLNKILNI